MAEQSAPKIGLWPETVRHWQEHTGEIGDIWRHEGLKKAFELGLFLGSRTSLGRTALEYYSGAEDVDDPRLATSIGSIALKGPVGIAPGWDKPGWTIAGWGVLGADFTMPGGVTYYPQPGNPMVRLRTFDNYVGDHGVSVSLNALGFNSPGTSKFVQIVEKQRERSDIPVIVQVTVNKHMYEAGNIDQIPEMISKTVKKVMPVADGIELGLSSPNTPGMRSSQNNEEFLYRAVVAAKEVIGDNIPLSYKGDADGGQERFEIFCRLIERTELDIISLINTTAKASIKAKYRAQDLPGGLAGDDPEFQMMALNMVTQMYEEKGDKVDIIAMGGVGSGDRALRMIKGGASAVAINTAIRRLGPKAAVKIKSGILKHRFMQDVTELKELIGSDTRRGPKYAKAA